MSPAFDLKRTETFFWDLISAPEGVRHGLDTLVRSGAAGAGDLDALIASDERLSAADRLDIYANMYFFRLLDCLKEDYPRLHTALGPERFHNLITDYLIRHPSERPSLRFLGQRLPGFLAAHALGLEAPCLVDLARLEWSRADLFDAADAPPLSRQDLSRLAEDEAGEARFRLIPAFTLLRLDHDAPRLFTEMKESAEGPPAPPQQPRRRTAARVWRRDFVVYHRAISDDEADGLDALGRGEPLSGIAQRLSAGHSASQATDRFGRMFQTWLDDGLLAEIVTAGK